jgi:hypothetical protein
MKQRSDKDLDRLIEEAAKEEFNSITPPMSTNEAWEIFNKRREQKKRKKKSIKAPTSFNKKFVYVASSIIIVISLFTLAPQNGAAFSKLTEIFNKIQGNVAQLFIKVGGSKENGNGPSSDEFTVIQGSEVISEQMGLEQAQSETSFPIIIPQWVPSDYYLKNVTVSKKTNKKSQDIYLNYQGDQNEFTIREVAIGNQFGLGTTVDHEDTKLEEVEINGHTATLLIYKNGFLEVIWTTQNHYFLIEGFLTREQMLKIARSM